MLHHGYQGNTWLLFVTLVLMAMIFYALHQARQKKKVGMPVNVRFLAGWCVWGLLMAAAALYEVFTHPGMW